MTRREVYLVLAALATLALLGAWTALPITDEDYQKAAVETATAAQSATGTLLLTARADSAGKVPVPYRETMVSDAVEALASQIARWQSLDLPSDAARALRDELTPLLAQALQFAQDLTLALDNADDAQISRITDAMSQVADRLGRFAEHYR